jgi:hypothetical protein
MPYEVTMMWFGRVGLSQREQQKLKVFENIVLELREMK